MRTITPNILSWPFCMPFMLIFSITWSTSSKNTHPTLAIIPLKSQGLSQNETTVISDRLGKELHETKKFDILERNLMAAILEEQELQQSDLCESDACLVEMGQLLGVQLMMAGSLGKIGDTYTLNARIIDVASGRILHQASEDCLCSPGEFLKTAPHNAAAKLAAQLTGEPEPRPLTPKSIKQSKKGRTLRRIAFGVLAAGFFAGGIILDNQIKSLVEDNSDIKKRYAAASDNSDYTEFSQNYKNNHKKAEDNATIRNICYGISGISAVGFIISIPF